MDHPIDWQFFWISTPWKYLPFFILFNVTFDKVQYLINLEFFVHIVLQMDTLLTHQVTNNLLTKLTSMNRGNFSYRFFLLLQIIFSRKLRFMKLFSTLITAEICHNFHEVALDELMGHMKVDITSTCRAHNQANHHFFINYRSANEPDVTRNPLQCPWISEGLLWCDFILGQEVSEPRTELGTRIHEVLDHF